MSASSSDRLASILGPVFWSAVFPSMAAANASAARRIASGRPAVSFTDSQGRAVCAWGERGAE